MVTVADIAASAFSAVAASITDAVQDGTLNDGSTDYAGRVVFGGEQPPQGFPIPTADSKQRPAYLEGFSAIPAPGWTLTAGGVVYYIGGVRDIVEAGTFAVANVVAAGDLLWQAATFERVTQTLDAYGAYADTWATLATTTVGLVALSGSERWQSSRVEAASQWRAWCEPVSGLTEKDRVTIDGRSYQIRFVNDIEARGIWQVLDLSLGDAT